MPDYAVLDLTEPSETLTPKLRGGYYTPPPIARFLAEWVVRTKTDRILEPSCGDGELLTAAARQLLQCGATPDQIANQLRATELFESEATQARNRLIDLGLDAYAIVSTGDFFAALGNDAVLSFSADEPTLAGWCFDAVIGNPPFLRYHTFPEAQRQRAFVEMERAGLHPSRLTNAWVPFLIASAQRLTKTGRLAMVIPAELLQVGYAGETRAYLARYFSTITIISFRKLVFDGIQQEVVLLLAERGPGTVHTIDTVELNDLSDLPRLASQLLVSQSHKPLTQTRDKWTMYFLEPAEIELMHLLAARTDIPKLSDLARVEVGVVTGNNGFFVQRETDVTDRGLREFVRPLVGRTAQLPGLRYTTADHERQRQNEIGCWLLDVPSATVLPESVRAYVQQGEQIGVHTGYKCRIRPTWYTVPSIWVPDAFLFRQIYKFPKLVANQTVATSTDTVHRMRLLQPIDPAQLAASFYNVLTFAFAEIIGRSYGGGVLEIEPREAGHLPVPFFADITLDIDEMDRLERAGQGATILRLTNQLLHDKLGLDAPDCQRLHTIWMKLSERRTGRKHVSQKPNGN